MSFQIKININSNSQIISDHGLDDQGRVTQFLRNEVDRLSRPYMPKRTGMLEASITYPASNIIRYGAPYSHYMYKGKLMLAKNGSSYAKLGERKYYTGKNLNYSTAVNPKAGAEWDKRMLNDKRSELVRNIENYIRGK